MSARAAALSSTTQSRRASLASLPWILTFGRTGLFAGVQAILALGFALAGSGDAWGQSEAWWPAVVTISNLMCLAALLALFRAEGKTYWAVFRIRRETLKGDLLALGASMLVIGPISVLPNIGLNSLLFDDPTTVLNLFVQPLPVWSIYSLLLVFPILQGLVETPLYFSYAMPRLKAQGLPAWLAVVIPGLMLGLQHVAAPLIFQANFMAWRALMYLPFALALGVLLHWRPRMQPYITFIHILMNMSLVFMYMPLAY